MRIIYRPQAEIIQEGPYRKRNQSLQRKGVGLNVGMVPLWRSCRPDYFPGCQNHFQEGEKMLIAAFVGKVRHFRYYLKQQKYLRWIQ